MARATVPKLCRLVATGMAFLCLTAGIVEASDYIHADARFSGREIYTFEDSDEMVTVVGGQFRLTVGTRVLSSRKAVLWVNTIDPAKMKHRLVIYLEGDARVEDIGGAITADNVMLVDLQVQGRIIASGTILQDSRAELPLYRRARQLRDLDKPTYQPSRRTGLEVVAVLDEPVSIDEAQTPPEPPAQEDIETVEDAPGSEPQEPIEPAPPTAPLPVSFFADSLTSEIVDGVRTTVARGNVYLSQGDPDSELFLELRAGNAVVFSTPSDTGQQTPTPGGIMPEMNTSENITGVYLEDDVVISRGERYFTGPQAYYDFQTRQATVIDPVFRTRQEQRNIPVWIRAKEARSLSEQEIYFRDASVSTSDFHTPRYSINSRDMRLEDRTSYDELGERISQRSWHINTTHSTFRIAGLPVAYWPYSSGEVTQSHTALRTIAVGQDSRFGLGVESQWHLFRLLGLVSPSGFRGTADFNYYDRGVLGGLNLKYARENFSGYALAYGLVDRTQEDDFGRVRKNIDAPRQRGRLLARHKQQVQGWEVQMELSYLCDRNFLEQFFSSEYWNGKEQETLIYVKRQKDNWAFTSLLQYRLNRFLTQTESFPDFGFYLVGQPLLNDRLTYYNESHGGVKRYRVDDSSNMSSSSTMLRGDTRNELNFPVSLGPVRLRHFAVGRLSGWGDSPDGNSQYRPYGQVGLSAATHIWRQYNSVRSRLWDLHGLRHTITPHATAFMSSTGGTDSDQLYPMDPSIEGIRSMQGAVVGIDQRLTTVRGVSGQRRQVEWMRLNLSGGWLHVSDPQPTFRSDGRFFEYRPESSLSRNFINGEFTWHMSDSTTFLADANFDIDRGRFTRTNFAISVRRDPRLSYFVGLRKIDDYDSAVATMGVNYQISRKYRLSFFEQYDLDFRGRQNVHTSVALIRKFERWYVGTSVSYNQWDDDLSVSLSVWPEGIPEVRIGMRSMDMLSGSDRN